MRSHMCLARQCMPALGFGTLARRGEGGCCHTDAIGIPRQCAFWAVWQHCCPVYIGQICSLRK